MFRLKGRPGEKGENWMLKKVDDEFTGPGEHAGRGGADQRHHRAHHGRDCGGQRRMATRAAPRRTAKIAKPPPNDSSRRNSRPWSMRCRAGRTGCSNINMTATACCSPPAAARRRPGPATATTGATSSAGWSRRRRALPAGCLIDGEAVALGEDGKPDFRTAPARAQGRRQRRPRFLRLRPAGRPRQGHHQAAQPRAQGAARRACSRASRADPLRRPYRRQGRGAVRRDLQGRRRGDHRQEGERALFGQARHELAQDQMHRSARNSSSSAGRRATSAAASARCTSRRATARR